MPSILLWHKLLWEMLHCVEIPFRGFVALRCQLHLTTAQHLDKYIKQLRVYFHHDVSNC